ncbi:MAG: four helix bundle protein [Clostridia bacterium]|nr:four helix bundle protein [Clostridia bacterium]
MSESSLRNKSKEFAKQIVVLCRDIKSNFRESVLTNQLLRSGTSIGANLHEAQYAQGTKDFISELEIAQKECYETEYWLELLFETGYIPDEQYKSLQNACGPFVVCLFRLLTQSKPKFDNMKIQRNAGYTYCLRDFVLEIGKS